MASKWEPVFELLTHMVDDDDLMLQWGLLEYGDVRAAQGRAEIVRWKRDDLARLAMAVAQRALP